MEPYTQEQLHNLFDTMPRRLRDLILSKETMNLIADIAKKSDLQEKEGVLRTTTYRVLAGILPIQKFRATIQEELQVPEEQARAIAYEIRDKIFAPVADDLRKLHNIP